MKDELFGLGRTWIMALVLIVGAFVMLSMGKINSDTFQYLITVGFGGGALKSTAVGVMKAKK